MTTYITLEEFGFDILSHGQKVKLAFGEKDPIRKLRGSALDKALSEIISKGSSSQSVLPQAINRPLAVPRAG